MERLSDISYDVVDDENADEKLEVFDEMFQLNKKKSSIMEKKTSQPDPVKAEPLTKSDDSYEVIEEGHSDIEILEKAPETQSEFEELAMSHADFDHLSQYDPDDEFLQGAQSISIL